MKESNRDEDFFVQERLEYAPFRCLGLDNFGWASEY
jgi:hypothetical protein